ncbi:MAG: hypothetical protein V1682_04405 [Candidatus Omnitrophota bacterium]
MYNLIEKLDGYDDNLPAMKYKIAIMAALIAGAAAFQAYADEEKPKAKGLDMVSDTVTTVLNSPGDGSRGHPKAVPAGIPNLSPTPRIPGTQY